jgi:inorganic phosphate transporter, PiT family
MVVSPILGFIAAYGFSRILLYFLRKKHPMKIKSFDMLQILSSTFYSLTHGSNDGQKTMGVITTLLIAGGF